MQTLILIVVGLIAIFILWKIAAPYFVRISNIFYTSGSPGTGKDILTSDYALKRYKVAFRSWKIRQIVIRLFKRPINAILKFIRVKARINYSIEPMPLLYTSIPLLIKMGKTPLISKQITLDIILLKKRVPNGSVCYISDINRFINQWSYKNPNIQENVAEMISEWRHYTKGGYFICNSQSSSQVAKEIRNTFGKVRNNLSFKKYGIVYRIEGRTITLSEDVLAVEQGDADNKVLGNSTNIWGILNPFLRRYDTYAYYGRVADMLIDSSRNFTQSNTNEFFDLPFDKVVANTVNSDNVGTYKRYFKYNKLALFKWLFVYIPFWFFVSVLIHSAIPIIVFLVIFGLLFLDTLI